VTAPSPSPRAVIVYRWLLRLYPAAFRCNHGPHMLQHFSDCYRLATRDGRRPSLRFWSAMVADLARTAFLEHADDAHTRRVTFWSLTAVLGLGIGVIDYSVVEVQSTLFFLLPVAFCLGFAAPRPAWCSALVIGLAIPVIHVVGRAVGAHPPYPDAVFPSLLALIPAFLATYSGTGARRVFRKDFGRGTGS
jgi:hypothetical protein